MAALLEKLLCFAANTVVWGEHGTAEEKHTPSGGPSSALPALAAGTYLEAFADGGAADVLLGVRCRGDLGPCDW